MHTITTKYLSPTDTLGARIRASTLTGLSVTIRYDYSLASCRAHDSAFFALCERLAITPDFLRASTEKGYIYISSQAEKVPYNDD